MTFSKKVDVSSIGTSTGSIDKSEIGLAGQGLSETGASKSVVGASLAISDGRDGEEESIRALFNAKSVVKI